MKATLRGPIALASALLLSGCSTDPEDGTVPPSVADAGFNDAADAPPEAALDAEVDAVSPDAAAIEEACRESHGQYCLMLARCMPALLAQDFGTEEYCRARLDDLSCPGQLPGLTMLDGCSEWGAAPCEEIFHSIMAGAGIGCPYVSGSLADGQTCAIDVQCASGACLGSDPNDGLWCGACASAPQEGDACMSWSDCADGLDCLNGICTRLPGLGEDCELGERCRGWLRCNEEQICDYPGMGGEGDDCLSLQDCNYSFGFICDGQFPSPKCRTIEAADPGEPCDLPLPGACGTSDCVNGVCVAKAQDGESCDDDVGPLCYPPARCVGGICTVPNWQSCDGKQGSSAE